jgi:hypothetical protein
MGARLGDGGLRRPRGPPGTPRPGRAHRRRRGPPVVVSLRTPPLPRGAPANAQFRSNRRARRGPWSFPVAGDPPQSPDPVDSKAARTRPGVAHPPVPQPAAVAWRRRSIGRGHRASRAPGLVSSRLEAANRSCVVPSPGPGGDRWAASAPERRDGGRFWRRLPPRGQVIGDLPGARRRADGADPTGAGRGHRLTAWADR